MDRSEKKHSPLPTVGSITDPAAEAANRHLGWTPDQGDIDESTLTEERVAEFPPHGFVSYVGTPDGAFEITVTLGGEDTVASQTERGFGETQTVIRETSRKAYEKADRALTVLSTDDDEDTFVPEEDEDK